MAKWFKEFPVTLKNGTDRIRSAFESSAQPRPDKAGLVVRTGTRTTGSKTGHRKNSSADRAGGGGGPGVGSCLSEKNRKNTGAELSGTGVSSQKDGKVLDSLLSGKNRKTSKAEQVFEEQRRPLKTSTYISRMIRVDKQDKTPNGTSTSSTVPTPEAEKQCKTESLIVLEDYADPFDAQRTRERSDAERLGENDGYMEPYDAQQMITEIRRRGSKDLLKVCAVVREGVMEEGHSAPLLIYDLPYEGSGDNERRTELDQRPASEYELPWEWRKEQIVRTLSAQFDSPVKYETFTRHPQHPAVQLQQHQWQKSKSLKMLRSSSANISHESETCSADTSLIKQSWYRGCVAHQEGGVSAALHRVQLNGQEHKLDNSKYSIALNSAPSSS